MESNMNCAQWCISMIYWKSWTDGGSLSAVSALCPHAQNGADVEDALLWPVVSRLLLPLLSRTQIEP